MLGKNGLPYLASTMESRDVEGFTSRGTLNAVSNLGPWVVNFENTVPMVVQHQWTRTCLAVQSTTGLVQAATDGIIVFNGAVDKMLEQARNKPNKTGRQKQQRPRHPCGKFGYRVYEVVQTKGSLGLCP